VAKELQNIFKSKSLCFIQYELQLLINQKYEGLNDNWEEGEVGIFTQIMREATAKGDINWRSVSFELFQRSNGQHFRGMNHCREMWLNHLDPQVKKSEWTTPEDICLFRLIHQFGLKWSKISKAMGKTRTEHMVKNRFNRFHRQWKLTKDATADTIFRLFREKIEKPYIRKQQHS
jgi:hypothetical protein